MGRLFVEGLKSTSTGDDEIVALALGESVVLGKPLREGELGGKVPEVGLV